MRASEMRRMRSRQEAAVYAYRHATVLLALTDGNVEADEALQIALGMLELAWAALDAGEHGTLSELSRAA